METVLILPLLLTMLGMVFWLGGIQLSRLKLVIGDRYMTWSLGNRHRWGGGRADLLSLQNDLDGLNEHDERFFKRLAGERLAAQSGSFQHTRQAFWCLPAAGLDLFYDIPEYLRGALGTADVCYHSQRRQTQIWPLHARGVENDADALPEASGTYEGGALVSRSGSYGYNGSRFQGIDAGRPMLLDWRRVASRERWAQ